MDARQERGLMLAATKAIVKRNNDTWLVPSQSGPGKYLVKIAGEQPTCSCPDFELRNQNCKHIFAVTYVLQREEHSDGSTTVTETVSVTSVRKTYPQNWPAYNAAQTNEQDKFQELLHNLCAGVPQPTYQGRGRRPLPLSDVIFSAAFKVYSTMSARRFMCDLRQAHTKGFISRVPHYNSIFNYLEDEGLTAILRDLITESSLPLQSVETDFAVDSSGFSTSRFTRWYDHKYGRLREKADWVKAHIMCGVKTNIITAIEIGAKSAGDSPFFAPMVNHTSKHFSISEVSADKAYSGDKNTNAVVAAGGTPFIIYKHNTTAKTGSAMWQQMFHYFQFKREEFLQHYHKRSNVESTFSMMKRKFGDSLRSKSDTAMVNETLCKVLCHNVTVLIHELHELGIEPIFWKNSLNPAHCAFKAN